MLGDPDSTKPPISQKRIKIGLMIIEMSKNLDELVTFDVKSIIKNFKP
jgi:hypothetical protein